MLTNQDIFHHCHIIKQANVLKCARNTTYQYLIRIESNRGFPPKRNLTARRTIDPGNEVKNRCFTCTIRPYNTYNFSRIDLQIHILNRNQSSKDFGDFFQLKQSTIHRLINSSFACWLCTIYAHSISPIWQLLNTHLFFKAWRSRHCIQRTNLHTFLCCMMQFTSPARTWDKPFRSENHDGNQDDTENQIADIPKRKAGDNLSNYTKNR